MVGNQIAYHNEFISEIEEINRRHSTILIIVTYHNIGDKLPLPITEFQGYHLFVRE